MQKNLGHSSIKNFIKKKFQKSPEIPSLVENKKKDLPRIKCFKEETCNFPYPKLKAVRKGVTDQENAEKQVLLKIIYL